MLLETVDFEVIVDGFEQDDIMCNSVLHMVDWKMPAHKAHWFASAPCLHLLIVCEERRRLCLRMVHGNATGARPLMTTTRSNGHQ